MMKSVMRWTVLAVAMALGGCGGAETEETGAPEQVASQESSGGTVRALSCPASSNVTSTTGCMDYAGWKKYSIAYCQGFGANCVASATSPYNSCGGDLYSAVTITCITY